MMFVFMFRFHYSENFDGSRIEVRDGLLEVIERMYPDTMQRRMIDHQLDKFERAEGMFGRAMTIDARDKKLPGSAQIHSLMNLFFCCHLNNVALFLLIALWW